MNVWLIAGVAMAVFGAFVLLSNIVWFATTLLSRFGFMRRHYSSAVPVVSTACFAVSSLILTKEGYPLLDNVLPQLAIADPGNWILAAGIPLWLWNRARSRMVGTRPKRRR